MTIDPSFLDELDRFDAALDRESAALHPGEQESPRLGEGLTFADYRRYSPGDDVRLVDWKLFARTEEYYIKQFEEERALTVHLLVDASASMDYGDGAAHKFEYGAKVALGFAYLVAADNDDFVVGTLGETVERIDAGRSSKGEVLALVDQLNATDPGGEAAFATALPTYAERIQSRSLVVVVSDCLADPDDVQTGVAALARQDADVLLVRTVAPGERDPDVVGDVVVRDPETGRDRRTYFDDALAVGYRSRLEEHVETVEDRVTTLGADHVSLDTGVPFFDGFVTVWFE